MIKNIYNSNTDAVIKINLTGKNFNANYIQFANNSKVSYSGTEEDYPLIGSKTKISEISFDGDGTNFDTFFKALVKYDNIGNLNIKNVIITDDSNSAIEQLKTIVTGVFKINGVNKKE